MEIYHLKVYKSLYRNKLGKKSKGISVYSRKQKSDRIVKKVLKLPLFRNARNILVYVSFKGEVDTRQLIRESLLLGKNVFVPRVNQRGKRISAVQIFDVSKELRRGSYGILEPIRFCSKTVLASGLDLVFVPGVGFDWLGGRLGRGEGYFDLFLRRRNRAIAIGLAFEEQVIGKVPVGAGDVPLDGLVTDSRVVMRDGRRNR